MTEKRFSYVKNNSISQYSLLPIREIGSKNYHCQGIVDKLNKLFDENEQLKEENQRLKHQVDIFVEFSERTIKILQEVKDNTQDNSYTSALMDSIANELGVDLND